MECSRKGLVAAAAAMARGDGSGPCGDFIPATPALPYVPVHTAKFRRHLPMNAFVACPVGKKAAMKAEWARLRAKGTWHDSVIREWDDVAREAKSRNAERRFGYRLVLRERD